MYIRMYETVFFYFLNILDLAIPRFACSPSNYAVDNEMLYRTCMQVFGTFYEQ